jgi:hypothetical protein
MNLTNEQCIEWAKREQWTITEAVFLLQGLLPPTNEMNAGQLIDKVLTSGWLLDPYDPFVPAEPEVERPVYWVGDAQRSNFKVTASWKAIFPLAGPGNLGALLDREPDYREFIKVFIRDTPTFFDELAGYVLNTNDPVKSSDEYKKLLRDMSQAFGSADTDKLANELISPRIFFEYCDANYFSMDSQCISPVNWLNWVEENPQLARWIQKKSQPKQVRKDFLDVIVLDYYEKFPQATSFQEFIEHNESGVQFNSDSGKYHAYDNKGELQSWTKRAITGRLKKWRR